MKGEGRTWMRINIGEGCMDGKRKERRVWMSEYREGSEGSQ